MGVGFVKVTDIPADLDRYMEINPRVPNRTKKGLLTGPVAKGILETLREIPEEMAIKNQGLYILADTAKYSHGKLRLSLSDVGKHGIINGGHTYAAIREAVESREPTDDLDSAYVRVNVYRGIEESYVPEIAEGLNRSRQVDDPSLINLQGQFDRIRKSLRSLPKPENVAYHQGDAGDVYISEVLVYLEMFNPQRYGERRYPNGLYNRQSAAIRYFQEDLDNEPKLVNALVDKLPDILRLADQIRKATPEASRRNGFRFGQAKVKGERLGGVSSKGMKLPFLNETIAYRVPNGWLYPMLSAFTTALRYEKGVLTWKIDPKKMLDDTIDDLVAVCISEHKTVGLRPELVGKRESAYARCRKDLELYLAKRGLLK